jgi:hypothetical protein
MQAAMAAVAVPIGKRATAYDLALCVEIVYMSRGQVFMLLLLHYSVSTPPFANGIPSASEFG